MRILVISPYFVPEALSEAFCGAKWVLALRDAGADVVVIKDTDNVGAWPIDSSPAWASLESCTLTITTRRKRDLLKSASCALRHQTWAWARWTDEVVRVARRLHYQSPFDVVVSRSLPWKACIAAYWIASMLRRPWVASWNDPWDPWRFGSEIKHWRPRGLDRLLMRFWLRRCLRFAARVTYPCPRVADYFARAGHVSDRAAIIQHVGWERRQNSASGRFTLVHAGRLGAAEITGGRSSLPLLRGLAQFLGDSPEARADCQLIFVGPEDPTTTRATHELGLSNHVKSVGRVSYDESLQYIGKSSVTVLVEGQYQEGIFLPSKLADYIAAHKPVLALSPRVGTVADIPTGNGVFRADPDDVKGAVAHIRFLYERFRRGELGSCEPPESLVKQFEPQFVARRFLDVVEEVIGG